MCVIFFDLSNTHKEPTCFTSGNKHSLVDVIFTCSSDLLYYVLIVGWVMFTILLSFNWSQMYLLKSLGDVHIEVLEISML